MRIAYLINKIQIFPTQPKVRTRSFFFLVSYPTTSSQSLALKHCLRFPSNQPEDRPPCFALSPLPGDELISLAIVCDRLEN